MWSKCAIIADRRAISGAIGTIDPATGTVTGVIGIIATAIVAIAMGGGIRWRLLAQAPLLAAH
ncbi:hypothetical protein O206_08235 [Ochrobactrum sp. EGD-AQ16]|uniref:Uncharacterized protein n=1 Tax=Ochrobactrum sp. PW1 TaxID=1882222 RepID=A0A292GIY1_9HYPH|nr:hypothetical protein O206_08235 [Ochrobactrum sp. EGD-AQ16]MBA8843747.1 hypothetical protein [Ochrobactrum sp. RH1CCR137]MBA8856714.1 hypothetical protein [Ochrobactrum sp. RH1CCR134]OAB83123.1 hypothetical protein A4G21_11670 [Brucella intermedia]OOC57912.1 hypothetical protein AS855_06415 [Brucella intermedia M86]BBA72934.1 hypothetical protein [Ochrobactrum sp. PW1]